MQECVQQCNESATAYFHAKVGLCHELNLDFIDMREKVFPRLWSRELCIMLLVRTHEDDEDLLHDILELERVDLERQGIFGTRNRSLVPPSGLECCLFTTTTRESATDANQGMERRQPLLPIVQHVTPETDVYVTGRRLLSTRSIPAEADDASSLQEPVFTPAATTGKHLNLFF